MGPRHHLRVLVWAWVFIVVRGCWCRRLKEVVGACVLLFEGVWVKVLVVVEAVGGHPCSPPLLHSGVAMGACCCLCMVVIVEGTGLREGLLPLLRGGNVDVGGRKESDTRCQFQNMNRPCVDLGQACWTCKQ